MTYKKSHIIKIFPNKMTFYYVFDFYYKVSHISASFHRKYANFCNNFVAPPFYGQKSKLALLKQLISAHCRLTKLLKFAIICLWKRRFIMERFIMQLQETVTINNIAVLYVLLHYILLFLLDKKHLHPLPSLFLTLVL